MKEGLGPAAEELTLGRAGQRRLQGIGELAVDERQSSAGLPRVQVQLYGPVQLCSALALRCDAPHQGSPLLRTAYETLHGACTATVAAVKPLCMARSAMQTIRCQKVNPADPHAGLVVVFGNLRA